MVTGSAGLKDLNIIRVPAVDGSTLTPPYPNFSPWGFFLCHGHRINPNQIACYNSHLKAMRMFLDSGEEYGLIGEDDIAGTDELPDVLQKVLRYAEVWDLVRLAGFRQKAYLPFADLGGGYQLVSDLRCCTSAACYLLNRKAADMFLRHYGTMRVYWDLAMFFSLPYGIREVTVAPFPVKLTEKSKDSQITGSDKFRYPPGSLHRFCFLTVLPYRFVTRNLRRLHRYRWALQRRFFPPQKEE
jgi:glycosyl transferase family 25